MPSPASLGFNPATPMQPSAPLAEQAESGSDPTRVGSRPDPGFARREEAAPSPAALGLGLATPLPPGAPSTAQAESGPDPTRVGSQPDPGFARMERGRSHPCAFLSVPVPALWPALNPHARTEF